MLSRNLRFVELPNGRAPMYWTSILKLLIPMIPMPRLELLPMQGAINLSHKPGWMERQTKLVLPITTNQVHRVSWDVKQDWTTNTGTIKFEILCQDGRTNKPVDLHFLTLPFSDGNMTISRSPLKNSDFLNYAKFLLATGQAQFESNTSNAVVLPGDSNTTIPFTFTNCGASGRSGPSVSQINSTYAGTSLDGNVTAGWKAGYQKWIVPVTGHYWIEAYGARGGNSATKVAEAALIVRGKFFLSRGRRCST